VSNEISIVGYLRARSGSEEDLGRRLHALAEPTRKEAGCIQYRIHRAADDPGTWMLYEVWQSSADLDAHLARRHVSDFVTAVAQLLREPMTFQSFHVADTRDEAVRHS
jgi:quinol monooxygenase YgiN